MPRPRGQRARRRSLRRAARARGAFPEWRGSRASPAPGRRLAASKPDRPFDVLELGRPEIGDRHIEPVARLPVGVLGETDRAGRGDPLQPRGDIDAVAHQIAVGLLDHVAEMNADAKVDAAFGRKTGIAFDEAVLHLDGAAHRVDHAAELDEASIPSSLNDALMMGVDGGIDQIAPQPPQPRQRAILILPREPAVADDIRDQNRRDFTHSPHSAPSGRRSE